MQLLTILATATTIAGAPVPGVATEVPVVEIQYYGGYDLPPEIRYGCSYPPCFRGPPPRRRWHGYPGYPGFHRRPPPRRYY
jgi:hypothetical protein